VFLPVLIPSKRDSTLKADFGLDGGGTGDVTSLTEKRAETCVNSNECIHVTWQMNSNIHHMGTHIYK
jgi:hypothetical protein